MLNEINMAKTAVTNLSKKYETAVGKSMSKYHFWGN